VHAASVCAHVCQALQRREELKALSDCISVATMLMCIMLQVSSTIGRQQTLRRGTDLVPALDDLPTAQFEVERRVAVETAIKFAACKQALRLGAGHDQIK